MFIFTADDKRVMKYTKKIRVLNILSDFYFLFKKNTENFYVLILKNKRLALIAACLLIFLFNVFFIFLNFDVLSAAPKKSKAKIKRERVIEEKQPTVKKPDGIDKNSDDVVIYKKGLSYYENGEYVKAVEYFKYIYEMYPKSFYYDMSIYFMGESYNKTGRLDDAVGAYALLIKHCPASALAPEALHNIAVIYRKKGVNAEAIKYYKFLIDEYPGSFWVEEAKSFVKYQKISAEVEESPAVSFKNIDKTAKVSQFEEIKVDEKQINLKDSDLKQYQVIKYGDADLSDYKVALAEHERGNIEKAKLLYQKMILKYKNSLWMPNAYYMLGSCYLAGGDLKAAIRFYSASLIYCKERVLRKEIMNKLADLLYVDRQYRLALRYYEVIAESDLPAEEKISLYYLIGDCNMKLGNSAEAAAAYAKITLDIVKAQELKTQAAAKKVSFPEAAPAGETYRETSENELRGAETSGVELIAKPENKDYLAGMEHFQAGNYIKAVSSFEKCMTAEPENAKAMWHLALCYQQIEKLSNAVEYLQKYIIKAPDSVEAKSLLAYIYSKQGKFDNACAEYLKIISSAPDSAAAKSAHDAIKRIEVIKNRLEREKNESK